MPEFRISAASVTGRDHLLREANRQDSFACRSVKVNEKPYLIGVVCDGCGSGEQSEVGATLTANFVAAEAGRMLSKGEFDLARLYTETVVFLGRIAGDICGENPRELSLFVQQTLMTTVLGCIVGEGDDETLVFAAGDGLIAVNDSLHVRDEANQPHYLAYHLLGETKFAPTFEVVERLPTENLQRLAIFSDGFKPALLPQVWGLSRQPRTLQRQFNIWSRQKHFSDDATAILVEREE